MRRPSPFDGSVDVLETREDKCELYQSAVKVDEVCFEARWAE
jgi:hypothetical protein